MRLQRPMNSWQPGVQKTLDWLGVQQDFKLTRSLARLKLTSKTLNWTGVHHEYRLNLTLFRLAQPCVAMHNHVQTDTAMHVHAWPNTIHAWLDATHVWPRTILWAHTTLWAPAQPCSAECGHNQSPVQLQGSWCGLTIDARCCWDWNRWFVLRRSVKD